MKQKLQEWWEERSSEEKAKAKKYGVGAAVLVALLSTYYLTGQDEKVEVAKPVEEEIQTDGNLLEADIRTKVDNDLGIMDAQIKDMKNTSDKRFDALQSLLEEIAENNQVSPDLNNLPAPSAGPDEPPLSSGVIEYPPMPELPPSFQQATPIENASVINNIQLEPQIIGSIGHSEGEAIKTPDTKKKKTVYLPPSFMPAKLLTGIDALTTEGGTSNPETIIFRIQAPAVLPNSLKANLKGCFVIGNAHGNLAKERVQVKIVSLACMALDGQAVIEEDVLGFVADKDGKRGMAGNVVTKSGALVGRAFLADLVGGIGGTVSSSSATVSTNPLGQTQVIDPDKALQAGLGEGVKGGANQMKKIFVDYIKQVSPIIEVGTAKDVTVVIQEGVELEIKGTSNVL